LNIDFAALKLKHNEVMRNDAPNIFISYRRADAPGHAGRIYDSLRRAFGAKQIFMDVSAIQPGESFGRRIERTLDASGAVVVIVGREWLNLLKSREREVGERDLVRAEMAAALKRNILIIPVLVEGAQMPTAAELPPDVQPLAERNALEVSDARWEYDMTRLVDALTQAPGIEKLGDSKFKRAWAGPLLAFLALCVVGAVVIGGWKFLRQRTPVRAAERPTAAASPANPRIFFHVNDYILQDFLERLTAAVERHDWRMVLTLFQGSNFKDQTGIGIDQPQYIAEGLGLHMVGNSIVKGNEHIEFKHLNDITRIELTRMTGPDEQGLLTIYGQVTRADGTPLKVEISLRRTETGGYELAPAVG
jgi:hypothetical protein